MSVSYIIPTRDRPDELADTIRRLGALPDHDAELIVADNASAQRPRLPDTLPNGIAVTTITLAENHAAAARNLAAQRARGSWLVMLDDDSNPTDTAYMRALDDAATDTLAVSADVHLPRLGTREQGGLPEVFIGCGVALRRDAYLEAGGYDPTFGYYAEEYDLAAKLLAMGGRTSFSQSFRVEHRKSSTGRDMNRILHHLVRNNGWVMQRHAPEDERRARLHEIRRRYYDIARRERAMDGFMRGLSELRRSIRQQVRTPLARDRFDRFTGLAHARAAMASVPARTRVAIIEPGKNAWAIELALREAGATLVPEDHAEVLVVGTMSPGPMLDAHARLRDDSSLGRPVRMPWVLPDTGASAPQAA